MKLTTLLVLALVFCLLAEQIDAKRRRRNRRRRKNRKGKALGKTGSNEVNEADVCRDCPFPSSAWHCVKDGEFCMRDTKGCSCEKGCRIYVEDYPEFIPAKLTRKQEKGKGKDIANCRKYRCQWMEYRQCVQLTIG